VNAYVYFGGKRGNWDGMEGGVLFAGRREEGRIMLLKISWFIGLGWRAWLTGSTPSQHTQSNDLKKEVKGGVVVV
jgi:hypothetical protein